MLLRDRHDIIAEQNAVGGWIEAELLCSCRVSEVETKDTIVVCCAVSIFVLKLRRRCVHVDEETIRNG